MSSALYLVLLFSALWTLSFCGTRQFHVVNEKKTWTDAQKHCREKYTDLATIESQEEMNAVKAVLNGTAGDFWMGLKQKEKEENTCWMWSDGSNFSYSNWKAGEPNNHGTDNCGELWREDGYRWNDAVCSKTKPFVCYKKLPLILIKEEKTWREALSYCRENHVDLVSVHTEEIQRWVESAVYYASTANVWMGLRHTCTLSFWFWVNGVSICYQNWAPGNGTGVEDCSGGERTGAVQSGSKQWVSLPEDQRLNFICTTSEELPPILINQNKTWREALSYCRENHVDLVSVHTEEIQRWVETAVYYASTANVWMGLRHTCTLSFWFWVNGVSICYQNWAPGNGTGVEDCSGGERTGAVQSGNKQWVSLPEDHRLNFICTTSEVMSSALYLVLLFSALWTLSFCGTRWFNVVNESKTWTDAQKHCRANFTDLATIESQEEMNALITVLNGRKSYLWIGLRQKVQQIKTSWIWSDGSNSSYTYWDTGEPNNNGTDNCGILWHLSTYRWNDLSCYYLHPFVCYKQLPLILINQKKTWREALRYCRVNHVDLVSVHTEEIQCWVEMMTKNASTANVWMGLRHTCVLSIWFWVSGSTLCYENWAPGNGTEVEDCSGGERSGAVQSGSKQWVSLPEDQRLNFICTTSEEI
ncbi:hypothetical protein AOLI_G00105060 [Acnodon oligacanthus]